MSIDMSQLQEKAFIQDYQFKSSLPLVARMRTAWNNIAARWYVRWHFDQQIEFNRLIAKVFTEQYEQLARQIAEQDKEIVQLSRTVAKMELQAKRYRNMVEKTLD